MAMKIRSLVIESQDCLLSSQMMFNYELSLHIGIHKGMCKHKASKHELKAYSGQLKKELLFWLSKAKSSFKCLK